MEYYFTKLLSCSFEEAEGKIIAALKEKGFGTVSEIDMKQKLNEKLGVDIRKYKILGMCNPGFAYKALQAEEKIGTMLPCNVLVIDKGDGTTEIAAVNPLASMMAIQNPDLGMLATEVTEILRATVAGL
ncbi:MAG TPA: DUF302 domain-containing protein [Bacteroidales bacterium]|nr:DUF302 domain-containing protein [Bacteroidales bacterium]